jgi:hypothetical protein
MRRRVAGRVVPDVSKERDSSIFILDPSKLENEGSMCLRKEASRCPQQHTAARPTQAEVPIYCLSLCD